MIRCFIPSKTPFDYLLALASLRLKPTLPPCQAVKTRRLLLERRSKSAEIADCKKTAVITAAAAPIFSHLLCEEQGTRKPLDPRGAVATEIP